MCFISVSTTGDVATHFTAISVESVAVVDCGGGLEREQLVVAGSVAVDWEQFSFVAVGDAASTVAIKEVEPDEVEAAVAGSAGAVAELTIATRIASDWIAQFAEHETVAVMLAIISSATRSIEYPTNSRWVIQSC